MLLCLSITLPFILQMTLAEASLRQLLSKVNARNKDFLWVLDIKKGNRGRVVLLFICSKSSKKWIYFELPF